MARTDWTLLERLKSDVSIIERIKRRIKHHRKSIFLKKNGEILLGKIDSIFSNLGFDYWIDYGTLLGAIREKDFIKYDDDIDIGTYVLDKNDINKLIEAFKKEKFILKEIVFADKTLVIHKYYYSFFCIDLFFYQKISNYEILTYAFSSDEETIFDEKGAKNSVVWESKNIIRNLKKVKFKNTYVNIPSNYTEYLKNYYGENFYEKIKLFNWQKMPAYKKIKIRGRSINVF